MDVDEESSSNVTAVTTEMRNLQIDLNKVDLSDLSDLPNVLIVKNLDEKIFTTDLYKVILYIRILSISV